MKSLISFWILFWLYLCYSSQWSVSFVLLVFALWSAALRRDLQVSWSCSLFRWSLLFFFFFLQMAFWYCLFCSNALFWFIFLAEKLWSGLENFVFDWLINADRWGSYDSLCMLYAHLCYFHFIYFIVPFLVHYDHTFVNYELLLVPNYHASLHFFINKWSGNPLEDGQSIILCPFDAVTDAKISPKQWTEHCHGTVAAPMGPDFSTQSVTTVTEKLDCRKIGLLVWLITSILLSLWKEIKANIKGIRRKSQEIEDEE